MVVANTQINEHPELMSASIRRGNYGEEPRIEVAIKRKGKSGRVDFCPISVDDALRIAEELLRSANILQKRTSNGGR